MERALRATRDLLKRKTFDDISISEILDRAGQSAGSFYARFPSKEHVFIELCRLVESEVRERVSEETAAWGDLPLAERIARLVRLIAELNIEHRDILRSMLLRLWRDPGGHRRVAREIRDEAFERLLTRELLGGCGDGPEPSERTLRWVMEVVVATSRHELLFGELSDARSGDDRVEEMISVLTGLALHGLTRTASPVQG